MVLRRVIRDLILCVIVACALIMCFGLINEAISGRYAIDTDEFTSVVGYGEEVSIKGIKFVDNRTLGFYRFSAEDEMTVRVDETTSVGKKELVISHGGKEYVIHFEVKYRVDFAVDGVTVDSQLVNSITEVVLPASPKDKTGYTFSHWDIDSIGELSANAVINAIYSEVDYPALDGYTATYGDTLGSVELEKNELGYWEFIDPLDTPVGNAGRREHAVRFVFYADASVNKYAYAVIDVAKKQYQFGEIHDEFYYDGEAHVPYIEGVEAIYGGSSNILPGVYSYTLELVDDNYFGIYEGTYEIKKPTVTVTVSSATIAYPASVPEFTFTVEGFENADLLGIQIDAPEFATQIGEYEIGIKYTNENVNYIIHKGTLTVVKGDLSVDAPEIGKVTFEDKLADIEFLGKYLGTWTWEDPETVVDDINGITAYAIFTHDDPNLNPVRMAIQIGNVAKKTLSFNVTESSFVYEAGKEHRLVYEIVGGLYHELYATLSVSGNEPATLAGTYRRTLVINDSRYEGSVIIDMVINKATPAVDFDTVYNTVWQETLRLESIVLPEGYSWQTPTYRITESGEKAYNVIFTPADTDNYLTVEGEITVKVEKAPVTVVGVLDSYEKIYDGLRFDIKTGIAAYYTDGELTVLYYKDGAPVNEIINSGEYLLVITVGEGKNYLGTTIERTVNVTPAINTQTVLTAQNAVYLGGVGSLTLPENVEGTWTWLENDLGGAGVKTLTAVFTPDENGNYLPRTVEVTVAVAKKTLSNPDVTLMLGYNGKHQTLGLVSNDVYTVEDNGGSSIGTYTAKITVCDYANYQWTDGSDVLTLTYAILSVENAFTYLPEDGLSFSYLSSLSSLVATAKFGGVIIEYKKAGAPESEFGERVPSDVGSYVVRYTTTDENCTAILTEMRTFSITPIEVVPAPSIVDTALAYNGNKQTAQLRDTLDGIYTVTDTGATNAGEIGTVTLTIYNRNYVWADGSSVLTLTYEIVKSENEWVVEPTVSDSVIYGDTLAVSGQAAYDTLEIYYRALGSDDDFTLGLPINAGVYEIMFTTSGLNADRAEARYATLTVNKREIEIPVANGSLVYNGTEQTAISEPASGLYTVSGGKAVNAGSYVATVTVISSNYKWAGTDDLSVNITYSIAKAQGAIVLNKPAYDFTYTGDSFFDLVKDAHSDNAEQGALVYTVTSYVKHDGVAMSTDDIRLAGRYIITVSAPETDNYLATDVTFTVTVAKMALTVPTEADKVYTGNPINVQNTNTDKYTVSGDLAATDVGEYTLTFTLTDYDNFEWLGNESSASVNRSYKIGTAVNGWAVEPEDVTAVYNGSSVTVSAEALHGEVTIVYMLGGEVVDAPVNAGVYTAIITATADNYSELVAYRTVVINKAAVDVPTTGALIFNGAEQYATVNGADLGVLYTIDSKTGAIHAGDVATVTLKLADAVNYKWATTSDITVTLSVTVAKANITFDGAPAVDSWTFGEEQTLPVVNVIPSQSHFDGLVTELIYAYGDGDFVTYSELAKTDGKLNAGTYYVKARVLDGTDWNGCESDIATFTVEKQTVITPEAQSGIIFDGRLHTSGIGATSLYTVADDGGVSVSTYYAYLTLADTTNYKWADEDGATVAVSYSIGKLVFSDSTVDNGGNTVEYGDAVNFKATISADLENVDLGAYVTYLYSLDGENWYASVSALAEALGTAKLNTGIYLIKTVVAESNDWESYERVDSFTVAKKLLLPPTPLTLTYNGSEQSAIVSADGYTVVGGSATHAGNYTATLTLTDASNYKWQGTDLDTLEIFYTVAKAKNSWTTVPALSGTSVDYSDAYTVSGAPLYDTLKYKYKKTTDAEYTLINSLSELPGAVGSYEIVLYTEGTNADALTATLYLTINKKTVTKPTSLPTVIYDGGVKTHGITTVEGMVVRNSVTATNAGETVSVTLGLLNDNYVWSDGTSADYTLSSTIQKATVTFGTLTVPELVYTQLPTPSVTVDKAFATSLVEYVYSRDKVNFYPISDLTVNGYLPAGDYWVKACANSTNVAYSESAATSFTVGKATPDTISVSWGSSPMSGTQYYQNLLTLNEKATTVSYNGVNVEVLSFSYKMKGAFAGNNTVYTVTVTPKDTDNFNSADIDVTVPLKTVATIGHGGTPYGTIEDAVINAPSGSVVWVVADNTGNVVIKTNLIIPSGVTLRLPHGTGSSDYNSNHKSTLTYDEHKLDAPAETNAAEYLKTYVRLAAGKKITVNGTIEISGELSGGGYSATYQEYAGHTARYYALLELETGAILDINGTVYALGYIRESENGKSEVYVNAGGSLNMPFVIRDFRTGNYMKAASDNPEYSPFTRFILMNVSPITTVYSGGKVVGYANLYAGSMHNHAEGVVIGSDTSAFVQLSSGRLVSKYDIDTEVLDLHFYGGAVLNEFKLSGGIIVGQLSSADYPLALSYHLNITLDREVGQTEDAVYTIGKNNEVYKMLPGAKIVVEEGVIFNVSTLNIYDSTFVEDIKKVNKSDHSQIISTIKCYPTDKGDAILIVRGTLNAQYIGGNVHTDTDGAKITVTKGVSVSNREITRFYEDTLSSTAVADIVVTNTLKLYYDGTLSRKQVILNTEYTSSTSDRAWNYVMPEIVEVKLQDGYGVRTEFAVFTDENGEIYLGAFDSSTTKDNPESIKVLKGATVTFYLTKNQLFSEGAKSSITVTSLDDVHSSDYTVDWAASSTAPVVYTVKAITVTGSGLSKLNGISIVYDTATGNVSVTLKSSSSGLSSGKSFSVNGTTATSSGWLLKSYTYTGSFSSDTTLNVV